MKGKEKEGEEKVECLGYKGRERMSDRYNMKEDGECQGKRGRATGDEEEIKGR